MKAEVGQRPEQPDDSSTFATLVDLLRWRAVNEPERTGYTFLADGETKEIRLTYGELDRRAQSIAARIQEHGGAGQPVLIVLPSGLDFVAAFFGCLYAGSIAVTAYPPRPNRPADRIGVIVQDSGAQVIITQANIRPRISASVAQSHASQAFSWIEIDAAVDAEANSDSPAADWVEPNITGDSVALLQYTSGSTAQPNGTVVSHANILHNLELTRQAFEHTADSVVVGWLPMTHDMGLIGNMLQPLYVGCHCIFMAPEHFLIRPIRWLKAISRYQATTSGGPNFAYDYCAQKIKPEQIADLDLSHWSLAFSGAEPVRANTIEHFSSAFASIGFQREAFYPCYGLAECTLMVTGGDKAAAPVENYFNADALSDMRAVIEPDEKVNRRALIGCGQPWLDLQLLIVDPDTRAACGDDQVGEIWIAGSSVAQGYWRQPETTAAVFAGYLQGDRQGPYLRTGDLGFIHAGQLFVSGRLKDLIIIAGANHFPVDLEISAENCHHAIRPNCVAAFSAEVDGAERLIIIAEIERHYLRDLDRSEESAGIGSRQLDQVKDAIRGGIAANHDLATYDICLVQQTTVPKTASGKIQRHLCRRQYLGGELSLVKS